MPDKISPDLNQRKVCGREDACVPLGETKQSIERDCGGGGVVAAPVKTEETSATSQLAVTSDQLPHEAAAGRPGRCDKRLWN
jgi:hypothetical protein